MSTTMFNAGEKQNWPALLPIGYAFFVTCYIAIRYGYRWAETDSAAFTRAIRGVTSAESLTPSGAYPNGFGYQTIVMTLAQATGLEVVTLQLVVLPFLTLVVGLCAFIALRTLMGNSILGGFAALLLFIQPEFLFVIERGNHEKVTHSFVLILVFLLTASLVRRQTSSSLVAIVLAYYVTVWALISTNSFFASSIVAGLTLALPGGILALRLARSTIAEYESARRTPYTVLASFALLFAFIAYIYDPAGHTLALYRTLVDQLSVLFLSGEPAGAPYSMVGAAWHPAWLYTFLSAFNWLVLISSGATWLWLAYRFRKDGVSQANRHLVLLCLLAAAFAIQVAGSVIVDLSGFLSANVQIRLFPLFMLFGVPLMVLGGSKLFSHLQGNARTAASVATACLLMAFAISGVLKATNDPLVSNKWLFFSDSEQHALAWADDRIDAREIWVGFDERLLVMQHIHQPVDTERENVFITGYTEQTPLYVATSDIIASRSLRLRIPSPNIQREDRIYDNGGAQIYHRVPESPYQP